MPSHHLHHHLPLRRQPYDCKPNRTCHQYHQIKPSPPLIIAPNAMIANLTQAIADNQASLVAARAVRDEQSMTQSIRREQDEAVEASLLQDRQKVVKEYCR